MNRFQEKLFIALGFLLPLHGAITVFFPELRFWKEGVLVLFLIIGIVVTIRQKKLFSSITPSEYWAFGFLIWLSALVCLNPNIQISSLSARYLGLGFLVFLIFGRVLGGMEDQQKIRSMYIFSWAFLWGCTVSVVFGIWGKYLGGFEVLQHFYSTTISSWVPGQVLPLYHGTGEAIRMQGASSGPIEFAHVLMVGMAIILFRFLPIQLYQGKMKWFVAALAVLTFFGIVESLSRAVILILVIWMLYFRFFPKGVCTMPSFRKTRVWILLFFFILAGGGIFLMNKKSVQRLSDSDHFIRPLQAIQIGIQKPIMGHLGEFGPAARLRNLQTYNNDQAPIAENVFADWFAQLGLIGLALGIGFFVSLFRDTRREHWPFLVATVLASQVATIYDMTPISISFFLMFAFFVKIRTIFLYI